VLFEQRGTRRSGQAEKIWKFFGKHVILARGEPRLGRYFFLVRKNEEMGSKMKKWGRV